MIRLDAREESWYHSRRDGAWSVPRFHPLDEGVSMPRAILRTLAFTLIFILPAFAHGDGPARVLPSASIPARHPVDRSGTSPRDGASRSGSSSGYWLGLVGIAVVLGGVGACRVGVKRLIPAGEAGALNLKVIGRASLSPRHTVYLLRAGDRVLIVGAGSQGAPSLLGELTESVVDRKDGASS